MIGRGTRPRTQRITAENVDVVAGGRGTRTRTQRITAENVDVVAPNHLAARPPPQFSVATSLSNAIKKSSQLEAI